jgi:hypothetical protein
LIAIPDLGKRWEGKTVCIFASGNSLTDAQIASAQAKRGWHYIAVNDTYKRAPFADVLYACDLKWWQAHIENIEFSGERWTRDRRIHRQYGVNWIASDNGHGLGLDRVHFGANSGYQAVNLAYLWGAARIVLLGFDCKPVNGKAHWFGQHEHGLNRIQNFALWAQNFKRLAADLRRLNIEVINCSPDTALDCFTLQDIDQIAD